METDSEQFCYCAHKAPEKSKAFKMEHVAISSFALLCSDGRNSPKRISENISEKENVTLMETKWKEIPR